MSRFQIIYLCIFIVLCCHSISFAGEISLHIDLSKASQSTVVIPSGHILKVTAPGNRAEGYEWNSATSEQMIISKQGETVYIPEGKDNLSGGRYHLQFKPTMPGKAVVRLEYVKPGEAPKHSYTINVTVPAVPDIDLVFDLIDVNRDNSISLEEFLSAPEIPVIVDPKGRLSIPVLAADANSDGLVNPEEIKSALFTFYDRDSSKNVTREEVVTLAGSAFIRLVLPASQKK